MSGLESLFVLLVFISAMGLSAMLGAVLSDLIIHLAMRDKRRLDRRKTRSQATLATKIGWKGK